MKIAFLEDNKMFADDIVSILQAAGHLVDHFLTGRDCLKKVSADHFDLCILDWEVPDMSGPEVLASLKLKGKYPPVIFFNRAR